MFMRFLRFIWSFVDITTRIFQFFLILTFCVLFFIIFSSADNISVPEAFILNLNLNGNIVDDYSIDDIDRFISTAQGLPVSETRLRDVIKAIRYAKSDERVIGISLRTDTLASAGLSKLQDIARELSSFKESGKPIISIGDYYTQNQYYLASHANKVYLNPFGFISMTGYSRFIPYYKSSLDIFGVDANVWAIGEFKSFVEPYVRDSMSDNDKYSSLIYLNALWSEYKNDVGLQRGISPDEIQKLIDNYALVLEEFNGDNGKLALATGLVDLVLDDINLNELLDKDFGIDNALDISNRVNFNDYLSLFSNDETREREKIAVITLSGAIIDGNESLGAISGDSTISLIKRASKDQEIKALVIRVDSPGGSGFASDAILKELVRFQKTGRPLVVSMSSIAASGGYWISMSADEIWASPTTLTGSIGVGAVIPTFNDTVGKLGITIDGIGTTKLSGQLDPARQLGPDIKNIMKQNIEFSYKSFIENVASYREKSLDEVDNFSRGRVWIASDAIGLGLVDKLGSLDDAINSAAVIAGIADEDFGIVNISNNESFTDRLSLFLMKSIYPLFNRIIPQAELPIIIDNMINEVFLPGVTINSIGGLKGIYSICLCDPS